MKVLALILITMAFAQTNVRAESHVIYDSGRTVPLSHYTGGGSVERPLTTYSIEEVEASINETFPLVSTIPRKNVDAYQLSDALSSLTYRAVALVGTDPLSQKWLNSKLTELRNLQATVIVIDAESYTQYSRFQHALTQAGISTMWAESTPFEPVATGYPVIIHNGKVYQ